MSLSIFPEHESKITVIVTFLYLFRCSVNEEHLMRFQSVTYVFKFLRRSVDGRSLFLRHFY